MHQLGHQQPVQRRLSREVERVQGLEVREHRCLETTVCGTLLAFDQLQLAELQKEAQVIDVVLGAAAGNLLALGQDRREFQRF